MDTRTILVDVGGTFIKCSDGRTIPIDSAGSREAIEASLREAVGDAESVAAAVPGPFDYDRGIFLMKHKFASAYGCSFEELVGHGGTFRFAHDVNAMLLGEISTGKCDAYGRIALVTLGTGLGFSMYIDGEILRNELGSPKESIFSLPYRDGILEDYASKRGFLRGMDGITVKELSVLARAGNRDAIERFFSVGVIIAENTHPILARYGIECLLFGGQISRSFELFEPGLRNLYESVPTLREIRPVSDIGNATFLGLETLLK